MILIESPLIGRHPLQLGEVQLRRAGDNNFQFLSPVVVVIKQSKTFIRSLYKRFDTGTYVACICPSTSIPKYMYDIVVFIMAKAVAPVDVCEREGGGYQTTNLSHVHFQH